MYGENNKIINVPINIGNLSKLTSLDLGNNKIIELPKSIGNLNIIVLNFSNNCIERIPDEVGNMKNLWAIYLTITKLPIFHLL